MNDKYKRKHPARKRFIFTVIYRKSGIYIAVVMILFLFIGFLTTVKPAYRFSSQLITEWTSDVDSSIFTYILSAENRVFHKMESINEQNANFSSLLLQVTTNIKSGDMKSLLGNELPGFSTYGNNIIVAGEGLDDMSFSIESSPPIKDILEDREAILEEPVEEKEVPNHDEQLTTGDKKVVFIYNTHNRESYLPHLPKVKDPNLAHHDTVNVTKVSERFSNALKKYGIGSQVDKTDIMKVLDEKGWTYGKSYQASRSVVTEAFSTNKDIQYIFDIHRDSIPKDKTTKTIDGQSYAQVLFVVGANYASYEKNLALATNLHYMLDEKYPGISKGVITKKGAGTNGVYNQDLSENALLLEIGGYDNHLDEVYRTTDVIAEVFSKMYWEAEKVDVKQ